MERDELSAGSGALVATALHSWNDGPTRSAIIDFVERVTAPGRDFIPRVRRIAAFDNDGTLWCEQPLQVQFFFGHQRLEAMVHKDPELKQRQPFKAYLEHDMEAIKRLGKQGLFEVAATAFAGSTEDDFDAEARSWLASARHPKLGARFIDLTYEPQLELLEYLKANGFKIFIVTGGGIDLVRALAEDAYGIPPEQVVGSSVKTRFELRDGLGVLVKEAEVDSFDDREVKVHNIGLHIGRRPILCFGNSDGDLAMLRYTLTGDGPRLGLLLHHDDADREFAYDREFHVSPLAEALDHADAYGIRLVSMKHDWRIVFATGARQSAA